MISVGDFWQGYKNSQFTARNGEKAVGKWGRVRGKGRSGSATGYGVVVVRTELDEWWTLLYAIITRAITHAYLFQYIPHVTHTASLAETAACSHFSLPIFRSPMFRCPCFRCSYYSSVFYRAMHFSAKRGLAIACRLSVSLSLSVRPSVCNVGGF